MRALLPALALIVTVALAVGAAQAQTLADFWAGRPTSSASPTRPLPASTRSRPSRWARARFTTAAPGGGPGPRDIYRNDFVQNWLYQGFNYQFQASAGHAYEFRTYWHDKAYIRQDLAFARRL